MSRLLQRVLDHRRAARGLMGEFLAVGEDRARAPILHLQNQQQAPRVEDDEIGMQRRQPERDVVPAEVVVLQLGLAARLWRRSPPLSKVQLPMDGMSTAISPRNDAAPSPHR